MDRREILTKNAVAALSDAPTGTLRIRDRALILVSYGLGCRVSEVIGLQFKGIDRDINRIHFYRPKQRDWLHNPLGRSGWAALEAYIAWRKATERIVQLHPFSTVFVSRTGKPLDRSAVARVIGKAGRNAGLPAHKCHPHILRHSRCTHLLDDGIAAPVVQKIMGHSSLATTQSYYHLLDSALDEAAALSDL